MVITRQIPYRVFTKYLPEFLPGYCLVKYPGIGKCPGKYPECIYLKVFTFSLLASLRNFTKFWKNWTKT